MTTVPMVPAVSITVFAVVVCLLRCVFLHETAGDRLVNRALVLATLGMIVVLCVDADTPVLIVHLRAVFGLFTASSVLGAARLLDGADPRGARRRQRRYDLVAAAGIALGLGLDLGYLLGLLPEIVSTSWYTLSGTLASAPLAFSGFLLMRAGIREIRSDQTRVAQKLVFVAFIGVACYWICYSAVLLVLYLRGTPPTDPGKVLTLMGFISFALIVGLFGNPLLGMAVLHLGWDRESRDCRKLRPLWTDLTAAVPHVTLAPEDVDLRGPDLRRYRMAVEIRDALLQLRRRGESGADELRLRTLDILREAESGTAGRDESGGERDHDAELRGLLDLAARWPRAKRAVANRATRARQAGALRSAAAYR